MKAPQAHAEDAVSAEIVAIGNELLLGIVQDTNTHWLCAEITRLGGAVRRATLIPDDFAAIEETLSRALTAQRDLIVLTGGLGPTEDDMTMRALGTALNLDVAERSDALAMIERRYRELAKARRVDQKALTPSRRKMAQLPEGAVPLFNPVGTAPGAVMENGPSTIVVLPGVPSELKGIWADSLQPYLDELFAGVFYDERHLVVDVNDESGLAPLLKDVQSDWPQVYVKSRPRSFAEGQMVWVTLAMGGEQTTVERTLADLAEELSQRLREAGYPVREASSDASPERTEHRTHEGGSLT